MTEAPQTPPPSVRVVTLGTAGGPQWWREGDAASPRIRSGISTAIVIGEDVYLVDAGYGAAAQLAHAGLSLAQVRAVFITHLHSDHTADLPALLLFGMYEAMANPHRPIPVFGPGPASVPTEHALAGFGERVNGVTGMVAQLERAFDADLFDRQVFGKRPGIAAFFAPVDLAPQERPDSGLPGDDIHETYADEQVRVRHTLVDHATMKPSYAFRFDTAAGSVTITGDMQPCDSLITLAGGTDILLHEAIDVDWIARMYPADGTLTEIQQASYTHHEESHSTVAQACANADAAGAGLLVLHHLVPGNTPAAQWERQAQRASGAVRVAEDLDVYELPLPR